MSEREPLVSVVVPCLNRAHFLGPTLESILQQDYPRIECIVVDGGSSDGTIEVLERYADRLRWVSEPDEGHADAINKGWGMSSGTILAWLNADDVWDVPKAVGRAVAYLKENPGVDVVYGDCGSIDEAGDPVGMTYLHEWDLEYAVVNCDHCIPQPAAFIRRSILERVGWLDPAFISKKDHELWLRIGMIGRIEHLPTVLAQERNQPGYLSERGDVTAKACIALTRKFYSLGDIPDPILTKRRRALSNAHLRAADYAWEDGRHWGFALLHLVRSAIRDPANSMSTWPRLRAMIATVVVAMRRRLVRGR